ncbi:hypothetical protein QBC45DRAFT_460695, partial [Copromyces sp. CBS 386.78]
MAPYQRASGAHAQSPARGIVPRSLHHRIERPQAPSAATRSVAARRYAILRHQLPSELLASAVQDNTTHLLVPHGLYLHIHASQPPRAVISNEDLRRYMNLDPNRRDEDLTMGDGHHPVSSGSLLFKSTPATNQAHHHLVACSQHQAASCPSFQPADPISPQQAISVGAQIPSPVIHSFLAPGPLAIPQQNLTVHDLAMLDSADSPRVPTWLSGFEESVAASQESSSNSEVSFTVSSTSTHKSDLDWLVFGGRPLQPKAGRCFEHMDSYRTFSRGKREWIADIHREGFYLCTGRYDAAINTPNTLCAKCQNRKARKAAQRQDWKNFFVSVFTSVFTWLEGIDEEEQESHPQWEGTL